MKTGAVASASMTHAVQMGRHCNIKFEITKNALVGRMVNPTFPNDRAQRRTRALSNTFPRDEYFFMIDRVYIGDLTSDDANELFCGSRRAGPKTAFVEDSTTIQAFGKSALRTPQTVKGIVEEFYKSRVDA